MNHNLLLIACSSMDGNIFTVLVITLYLFKVDLMSQISEVVKTNLMSHQKAPFVFPRFNSLFGKLLLPVIGFMLLSMIVTELVFNFGMRATSLRILEQEVQSDNQQVIQSLGGRVQTVLAAAGILANNNDIKRALEESTTDSLSTLNSRALILRERFELDLVQIYAANGEERTNLVQSSLYKVSSVIGFLPVSGANLFYVDGRFVYLVRENIKGGGVVIVGIDLRSELNRITFQLGLRDSLSFEQSDQTAEKGSIIKSNYILTTPFFIGTHSITLVHSRSISQINTIADSGRNLIMVTTAAATLLLITLMAFVLQSIVRPIRRLATAANQLAQADFENTSPNALMLENLGKPFWIGKNDEVGLLADSFVHMSNELTNIYQGLVYNLRQANQELSLAYDSALQGWSSALELRDHDIEKHTTRVAEKLVSLARFMEIPEEEIVHYRRGALLHDVGKMAVPDAVLRKTGPLSEQEWQIIRQHPIYAYVMLRKIPFLQKALDIPYSHHEKWDGSGYPRGLLQTQIPISVRIFSVLDTWDALLYDRPYRKAWTKDKALEYIASQSGKDFDPDVVDAFFEWMKIQNL
jgi:putative nucleotidyltransferase with HDIG domain